MSEIRSCEEYVVARLQDVENELEKAADLIDEQDNIIQNLRGALIHLMTDCVVLNHSSSSAKDYFDFRYSCWSGESEFDFVKSLYDTFNQNKTDEEDGEEDE